MNEEPRDEELTGYGKMLNQSIAQRQEASFVVPKAQPCIVTLPKKARKGKLRLRTWAEAELLVPEGVTEIERLTYVPGLVGEITDWIVATAPRPNRMMALASALVVIGTLIGRRVIGPTGSATHLYIVILLPSGWGKDRPLKAGIELVDAVAPDLVGPMEFASAPGFIEHLLAHPCVACFIDEMGDQLKLIKSQGNNAFVSLLIGTLKKTYNAWEIIRTAAKVGRPSEKLVWPAVSLVGAATPEMFYGQLDPGDLESGFVNRIMVWPSEGYRRPPEQFVPRDRMKPPEALIADLRLLYVPTPIGDVAMNLAPGESAGQGKPPYEREEFGWTDEARDAYLAFSCALDKLQETDKKRYELLLRGCENASRLATIVAMGRGADRVELEDIRRAIEWAQLSATNMQRDLAKYLHEHYDFPKFCAVVWEQVWSKPYHFMSKRTYARAFGRNQKWGNELDRVTAQLVREGRLIWCEAGREHDYGPATEGWKAVKDEGEG